MIRLAMASRAKLAIFPMQDILGLGEETRMNRPAHGDGNWCWRLKPDSLASNIKNRLADLTYIYNRA
jgi:4-alpha-glucanotransferase